MAALDGSLYRLETSSNGTDFTPVVLQTNCSLSFTTGERTIGAKDVCKWEQSVPTITSYTVTGEALMDNSGHSFDELFALLNTTFDWKLVPVDCAGQPVPTESTYSGTGYLTGLEGAFPDKDNATTSVTIKGTGAVTIA